jgi:DNA-binding PadR family transcriptional regulator
MRKISSSETVLLHLRNFWNIRGELPTDITQDGISQATNIRRSHIPRILQRMRQSGLVDERAEHVRTLKRRIKTYFLTEVGFKKVQEILTELLKTRITLCRESGDVELSLGEACTLLDMKPSDIINQLTPNDILILSEGIREEFLDREEELAKLKDEFASKAKVIALYGSKGIGKTTIARKFVQELPKNWRIVWYDLSDKTAKDFFAYFSKYLGLKVTVESARLADNLCTSLQGSNTLIVIDGYFQIPDELVDFFSYLAIRIEFVDGLKALFALNEATPSYCRFYKLDSVKSGIVTEMHIKGLDRENCLRLLGDDEIDENSFERLFLMTKGCPLYIKLIRDESIEGLKKNSRFTLPEIKLLIHYMKTKKKNKRSEEN